MIETPLDETSGESAKPIVKSAEPAAPLSAKLTSKVRRHQYLKGSIDINVLFAFLFGVVFLSIILVFATYYPNPEPFQVKAFITALSLAAAGVGAVLPGSLEISYKGLVRASGALGLFLIVWFSQPVIEKRVVTLKSPAQSPEPVVDSFLSALNETNLSKAYESVDPAIRDSLSLTLQTWEQLYNTTLRDLGKVKERRLVGVNSFESPSGFPIGLYRQFNYLTRFQNEEDCRGESVTVRATQDDEWRIAYYNIAPVSVECPKSFRGD